MTTAETGRELPSSGQALAAGLRWLYETEQPEGAVLQHHGVVIHAAGNRWFGFVPSGAHGQVVVTVNVTKVEHNAEQEITNPLEPDELGNLAAALATAGFEVGHTWNGHPAPTGSVALLPAAHPSLLAAVGRYRDGCPEHKTVFCSREQSCTWYSDGYDRIVRPTVTDSEFPAPPARTRPKRAAASTSAAALPRNRAIRVPPRHHHT